MQYDGSFVPMYDTNSQPDQDMFVSNLVSVQSEETKDKLGRCILILHLICYSIQSKQLLGLILIERRGLALSLKLVKIFVQVKRFPDCTRGLTRPQF